MNGDDMLRIVLVSAGSGAWMVLTEGRRRRAAEKAARDRDESAQRVYFFWRKLGALWRRRAEQRAANRRLVKRLR